MALKLYSGRHNWKSTWKCQWVAPKNIIDNLISCDCRIITLFIHTLSAACSTIYHRCDRLIPIERIEMLQCWRQFQTILFASKATWKIDWHNRTKKWKSWVRWIEQVQCVERIFNFFKCVNLLNNIKLIDCIAT